MPRNVTIAASLPASPDYLYDMYLDPDAHAAFTGAPVTIEARPGAPFSAFEGMLSGTILHLQPKRLIVQSWRSGNWPEDAVDSVLVLTFHPARANETRIELNHINVPLEDYAGVSEGWQKYYWGPWRDFLNQQQ